MRWVRLTDSAGRAVLIRPKAIQGLRDLSDGADAKSALLVAGRELLLLRDTVQEVVAALVALNTPVAQPALDTPAAQPPAQTLSSEEVTRLIARAADLWQIRPADLTGPRRHRLVVEARNAVVLVLTRRGTPHRVIAAALERERSTIVTAAHRAHDRYRTSALFRARVDALGGAREEPESAREV